MKFTVKEVFLTLQGEGVQTGVPSVFVRFSGCNLWTGRESDRESSAARSGARCPLFCDTDFVGGDAMTEDHLVEVVRRHATSPGGTVPNVVFTGGEPLLQLNRRPSLVRRVSEELGMRTSVETNGTVAVSEEVLRHLDWICVSPKVAPGDVVVREGHEIKVVFPSYDPVAFDDIARNFKHKIVQPEAPSDGRSIVARDVIDRAAKFCLENPSWRLGLQTHKILELP